MRKINGLATTTVPSIRLSTSSTLLSFLTIFHKECQINCFETSTFYFAKQDVGNLFSGTSATSFKQAVQELCYLTIAIEYKHH